MKNIHMSNYTWVKHQASDVVGMMIFSIRCLNERNIVISSVYSLTSEYIKIFFVISSEAKDIIRTSVYRCWKKCRMEWFNFRLICHVNFKNQHQWKALNLIKNADYFSILTFDDIKVGNKIPHVSGCNLWRNLPGILILDFIILSHRIVLRARGNAIFIEDKFTTWYESMIL